MHMEIKSYLEQTSAIYIGTFMINVDRIDLFKIFMELGLTEFIIFYSMNNRQNFKEMLFRQIS